MRIRWTLPVLNVAILLTGTSWVNAQYGGGDDYPLTLRSSTIQEGAQRGLADLLRSQGQQAKLNAEAAVIFGQAQQEALVKDTECACYFAAQMRHSGKS